MRVFFDQGTPVPLRHHLPGHTISTAHGMGWSNIENGELLRDAENHGFEVLVTMDTNPRHLQNLANRRTAIVVLGSASWPRIRHVLSDVLNAVDSARSENYMEVPVPDALSNGIRAEADGKEAQVFRHTTARLGVQ
uniref:VapC45 PIN like domain-containing protein n=1 Tax=Candidatus Kentrum sp. FW TaxID=2126338 RepID=A0A450TXI6_9GAMM|nr:MAG: hypothetical protein BECKFW1821C_GA0114237_105724 [Candidatus Kentron sp. FW]